MEKWKPGWVTGRGCGFGDDAMDVQQLMTWGIVAAAAGSLARRLWATVKGTGGDCGGCGGNCGKPVHAVPKGVRTAPEAKPLITLERRKALTRVQE
jgi:hypothetical protein